MATRIIRTHPGISKKLLKLARHAVLTLKIQKQKHGKK